VGWAGTNTDKKIAEYYSLPKEDAFKRPWRFEIITSQQLRAGTSTEQRYLHFETESNKRTIIRNFWKLSNSNQTQFSHIEYILNL